MKLKNKFFYFFIMTMFCADAYSIDKNLTINGKLIDTDTKNNKLEAIPIGHNYYLLRDNSGKKFKVKLHKYYSKNNSERE